MIRLFALIAAVAVLATGCSGDVGEAGGRDVSREEFAAYLKYKRIPEDNKQQVQRMLEDYLQREGLAAEIEDTDLLDQDAIEMEVNEFRKQMLISRYFEKFLEDKVNDAAVSNYYAQHAAEFEAKKAHLAHILLRVRPEMTKEERDAKLTAATEALSRIKRGEDFAALAKQLSEDTITAANGGDLGWMKEGAVSSSFSQAAFALSPGQTSEIVRTPFGFHIVKMIEAPQVVKQPLEAVQGDIRYLLRQQAKDAESKRLMEQADIEVGTWE